LAYILYGGGGTVQYNKNRHLQRLAGILEIPQDIVLDLPRITMLGNKQLLVENHKGIIEYTPSLVRINLEQGELIIHGKGLVLSNLQVEQILVEGTVGEVKYDT
jgi:sporulation protein YqfC